MCGYLTKQGARVRSWKRRWFVLRNLCLYYYKAPEDIRAIGLVPLPSYVVCEVEKADGIDKEHAFKVCHAGSRTYYFAAETKAIKDRWMEAIRHACHAEQVDMMGGTEDPRDSP